MWALGSIRLLEEENEERKILFVIGREEYGGILPSVVRALVRGMPMAWGGLFISATGEIIGFCFGTGRAIEIGETFEVWRVAFIQRLQLSGYHG